MGSRFLILRNTAFPRSLTPPNYRRAIHPPKPPVLVCSPSGFSLPPSPSSSSYQFFNMQLDSAPLTHFPSTVLSPRSLATCTFSFHLSSSRSFYPNSMICIKKSGNRWPRTPISLEEEGKSAKHRGQVGNWTHISESQPRHALP